MAAPDKITLSEAKPNEEEHVPSKLQADTLFHFTKKLDWLLEAIKNRMLSSRYNCENLEAFEIPGLSSWAYPMTCFCDINLHKLRDHIDWYGSYGIAFSKEWGMRNGIQPVQYINSQSPLCKDMASALGEALSIMDETEPESLQNMLESFSILQLMYWKPYQGMQKKVSSDAELELKCFSDESEWRFIPDVSVLKMSEIIRDENILVGGLLDEYSDALDGKEQASLGFRYDDVKHIILGRRHDYETFLDAIGSWNIDAADCRTLCSKVLIWEDIKDDV